MLADITGRRTLRHGRRLLRAGLVLAAVGLLPGCGGGDRACYGRAATNSRSSRLKRAASCQKGAWPTPGYSDRRACGMAAACCSAGATARALCPSGGAGSASLTRGESA